MPDALRKMSVARDEASSQEAYNYALDAIGHNHSGSVYSALVPALPFLLRVAFEADLWPRRTALEVMTDAVSWLNWGTRRHAEEPDPFAALACFEAHRAAIRELVDAEGVAPEIRTSARSLVECLADADRCALERRGSASQR